MENYSKIFKKCPLFCGIEDEKLYTMLGCLGARVVHFDKKSEIFAEGESAGRIGILLSGSARAVRSDSFGNRNILAVIEPADIFGADFACAEVETLPISIIAEEDSEVMLVNSSHILHTCSKNCAFHQRMIYNLMKDLATKNISYHQKIEVTSGRTTREKLLIYLGLYSAKTGKRSFTIPFNRQELADYLEVDRSGLSVEISKLSKEGVIESRKNCFTIK